MRGTSRNKEVDWKNIVRAVENLRVIAEWTARDRASTDHYYNFRPRHRRIGLFKSQAHVLGDGTSNQKAVGMAWRCNELNAESAEIEHHGIQNINVRLASVTSAGADLSEFERSPEDPVRLFSKTTCQSQGFPFGQDQIIPIAGCELILRSETDRSFGTCV